LEKERIKRVIYVKAEVGEQKLRSEGRKRRKRMRREEKRKKEKQRSYLEDNRKRELGRGQSANILLPA